MRFKQTLKKLAVIWDFEVQELMDDDELLKPVGLCQQLRVKRDAAETRAGSPFSRHPLNPDLFWPRFDSR